MQFTSDGTDHTEEIIGLFTAVFTASEGPDEGRLIGSLVEELCRTTAEDDMLIFSAWNDGLPLGCIVFSRLTFENDDRTVFLLGPVAIATDHQGKGIGLRLLTHGLAELRKRRVEIVLTYGDPGYYAKAGFEPVCAKMAPPPRKLGRPEGWLAQSLTGPRFEPLKGPSRCVAAFDKPDFW